MLREALLQGHEGEATVTNDDDFVAGVGSDVPLVVTDSAQLYESLFCSWGTDVVVSRSLLCELARATADIRTGASRPWRDFLAARLKGNPRVPLPPSVYVHLWQEKLIHRLHPEEEEGEEKGGGGGGGGEGEEKEGGGGGEVTRDPDAALEKVLSFIFELETVSQCVDASHFRAQDDRFGFCFRVRTPRIRGVKSLICEFFNERVGYAISALAATVSKNTEQVIELVLSVSAEVTPPQLARSLDRLLRKLRSFFNPRFAAKSRGKSEGGPNPRERFSRFAGDMIVLTPVGVVLTDCLDDHVCSAILKSGDFAVADDASGSSTFGLDRGDLINARRTHDEYAAPPPDVAGSHMSSSFERASTDASCETNEKKISTPKAVTALRVRFSAMANRVRVLEKEVDRFRGFEATLERLQVATLSSSPNPVPSVASIELIDFLRSLELLHYLPNFVEAEVRYQDLPLLLEEPELAMQCVPKLAPRLRLMKAIRSRF